MGARFPLWRAARTRSRTVRRSAAPAITGLRRHQMDQVTAASDTGTRALDTRFRSRPPIRPVSWRGDFHYARVGYGARDVPGKVTCCRSSPSHISGTHSWPASLPNRRAALIPGQFPGSVRIPGRRYMCEPGGSAGSLRKRSGHPEPVTTDVQQCNLFTAPAGQTQADRPMLQAGGWIFPPHPVPLIGCRSPPREGTPSRAAPFNTRAAACCPSDTMLECRTPSLAADRC
jgi:hypothetical protein